MRSSCLLLISVLAFASVKPSFSSSLGPQLVTSTPLSSGTVFAAPNGSGTACTQAAPGNLATALNKANAGDVVFLRGGTYNITANVYFGNTGAQSDPITVESYPGETAILDGSSLSAGSGIYVRITGHWYILRKLEIRNMPMSGLWIGGTHNVVDGLYVHGSKLSGIHVFSPYDEYPYGAYGSYNTIQNCVVAENSGAGINDAEYADGGNSDGISISSGDSNRVLHCFAENNSDDGIDTWRSTNSYVGYSIVSGSGIASGNGNGFKAGGASPSSGTVIEHCISFQNNSAGFDVNSGINVRLSYNTSWDNLARGYYSYETTTMDHNISAADLFDPEDIGIQTNNSWQRGSSPSFIDTDTASEDFLRPSVGGGFEDIGALADLTSAITISKESHGNTVLGYSVIRRVNICTVDGKLVRTYQAPVALSCSDKTLEWDCRGFSTGTYLVRAMTDKGPYNGRLILVS